MMMNKITCREVIGLIIDIIIQDGEGKTDGEVLDEIWLTLQANGFTPEH
jgi:hypothetical protein